MPKARRGRKSHALEPCLAESKACRICPLPANINLRNLRWPRFYRSNHPGFLFIQKTPSASIKTGSTKPAYQPSRKTIAAALKASAITRLILASGGLNILWSSQQALSFYAKRQKRVRRRVAPSHKRQGLAAKNQLRGGGERKVDTLPASFGTGAAGEMPCQGEGAFARPCPLAQRRAVFPAGRQAWAQRPWNQRLRVRRDSPGCASIVRPMSLGAWIGWKQSGRQQVNAQVTPKLCANTVEVLRYSG